MHGGGTGCGLRQSQGASGSPTFDLPCQVDLHDPNPMPCTGSCSSVLRNEATQQWSVCIELARSTTRVGSSLMPATHPGEISADERHDELHRRPDGRARSARDDMEFDEVLTLLKLGAQVVP